MLSSHCDNMLPYYAAGGGRRDVLLDHHHHHRRYRPNVEVAPSCPRCDSPNTKFCYYNNYSLSQPRYFCKGCRRYWTKGGSLRNVPVGGGCRKNRRGKASPSARSLAAAAVADGGAAFSHRFPGAVRPDVLLEGMAGDLGHSQQTVSADKPAAAEGLAIDLALLYAKFLNRQPAAVVEQCAVVPEWVDTTTSRSTSDMSPNAAAETAPPDVHAFSSHDGFGDLLSVPATADHPAAATDPRAEALGEELAFSVDQSCYDSLGLHTDDLMLQPTTTWRREAKFEPFDPLPEDDISLHDGNVVAAADDVWSSALACHGLEAALCRP